MLGRRQSIRLSASPRLTLSCSAVTCIISYEDIEYTKNSPPMFNLSSPDNVPRVKVSRECLCRGYRGATKSIVSPRVADPSLAHGGDTAFLRSTSRTWIPSRGSKFQGSKQTPLGKHSRANSVPNTNVPRRFPQVQRKRTAQQQCHQTRKWRVGCKAATQSFLRPPLLAPPIPQSPYP